MNQRVLPFILIISLLLLLTGCNRKMPEISTDVPTLPVLQSGEPTAWSSLPGQETDEPELPPEIGTFPSHRTEPSDGTASDPGTDSSGETTLPPAETDPVLTGPSATDPAVAPETSGGFREESPEDLATRPSRREELPCSLEPVLVQLLEEQEGTWSLYLKNLDTREVVSIHDEPMVAASLIKLYVAGAYYATDPEGENTERTELVRSMINVSSNEACNRLIDLLGKDNINDFIRAEGCRNTELNRKMLEQVPVENYTSTRECGAVLEAVLRESYVSPAASRDLLRDLKEQDRTGKIPAGVPHGVETANKTGELLNVENDACIVWSDGGTYILCVMASDLTNTYAAREAIVGISRTVYEFFTERTPQDQP